MIGARVRRYLVGVVVLAAASSIQAQTIEVFAGQGKFVDIPGTHVSMDVSAMTVGPDGNLYLSSGLNSELMRLRIADGTVTKLPGQPNLDNLRVPGQLVGMDFDSTGTLYAVTSGTSFYRLNVDTGVVTSVGGVPNPGRGRFGPDGTFYYVSYSDSAVRARLPNGQVVLFAGDGTQGFSGDGGLATSARLNNPQSLAIAPNGDVYISDAANSRVRKVSKATGIITTVAGTGGSSFQGPGLLATQTNMPYPPAIALDSVGNLYVSIGFYAILRVDAVTNLVSMYAGTTVSGYSGDGGPAVNAQINGPGQLVFDQDDNLYMVDRGAKSGSLIRKVTRSSGVISTLFGFANGGYYFCGEGIPAVAACYADTGGIDVDAAGNLTIADSYNQRVRRVSASSGLSETFSATPGIEPYGVEHDPAGNIYFTSLTDNRVYRIDAVTGARTVYAGSGKSGSGGDYGPATSAQFLNPNDLAFDAAGTLYIADTDNSRIRKIDPTTGIITSLNASVTNPNTIKVDAAGNLYVSNGQACRITKINPVTQVSTTLAGNGFCVTDNQGDGGPATAAKVGINTALAVDDRGNVYLSWSNMLRRIDAVTGIITTVRLPTSTGGFNMPNGDRIAYPMFMEFDAQGRLYVDDRYDHIVMRISGLRDTTPPVVQPNIAGTAGTGGWYRSNVQVSWTVSDAESTVTSTTGCASSSVTADTSGVTFNCSATSDGGTTTRSVTIRRDTAAPTLAFGAVSPAPDANGWNNDVVRIPFTAQDALSGVYLTSSGSPLTINQEGTGLTQQVTVTDFAGNTATFTSPAVNIDRSAPVVSASVTGTKGNAGWYRSDVQVTWNIDDATSLVSSDGCGVTTISEDTAGTTLTCTATSAGGTSSQSVTIKRDATPPSLTFGDATPAADAKGWRSGPVLVSFDAKDATSGVASSSSPSPLPVNGTGAGVTAQVTVTDVAGNSATFTSPVFNIDASAPVVTHSISGILGNNGWYRGDVHVTWQVNEPDSETSTEGCEDAAVTADTSGITFNCSAASSGGVTHQSVTIKRDATPPTLNWGTGSPGANGAGWNTTDVAFPFTASDELSGFFEASHESPVVVSGDGPGRTGQVTIRDNAGNESMFSTPAVNIDRVAPVINYVVNGTPGNNGWYTGDVQVSWQVIKAPENILAQSGCGNATVTTDTAGTTFGCTVTSGAGTASSSVTVKRDATPPVLTFGTPSPAPNANGWNKTNVSIPFTRSDAMSGLASTSIASPLVLATDGANVTGQVVVTDLAGNSATFTSVPRNIDKTPPTAEMNTPEDNATYGFYQDVVADFWCNDSLLVSCTAPTANGALINTKTAGTLTYKITAKDSVYTFTHTHTYYVESAFNFDGFLAPASAAPTLNLVTRGALVPIRWQLPDGRGGYVTNPASFTSATVGSLTCGSAASVPLNDVSNGAAGISFDAATQSFVYNWQTSASWTGCRKLTIKLKDSSTHELRFKFQ